MADIMFHMHRNILSNPQIAIASYTREWQKVKMASQWHHLLAQRLHDQKDVIANDTNLNPSKL